MSPDAATPPEQAPKDPKDRGLFPKFAVHRVDGTDGPGGKHEECVSSLFVLDIVHDPLARQAYALYAMLADQHGYHALAADMVSNLRVVDTYIAEDTDEDTKIRMVATWTYPQASGHAYTEVVGYDAARRLTAAEKAGLDANGAEENELGLVDYADWADPGSLRVHFSPDA